MNFIKKLLPITLALITPVQAATIAQFDVNSNADTQTGFQAYAVAASNATQAGLTMTITGTGLNEHRDRNISPSTSGTWTPIGTGFEDLATDFRFARAGELAEFNISGLDASTDYVIRIWSWEKDTGGTIRTNWYQDSIAAPNLLGQHTIVRSGGTLEDLYFDATFTSDSGGNLSVIGQSDTGNLLFLNGVEIMTVPEPASTCFLILGFGALLLQRRRSEM